MYEHMYFIICFRTVQFLKSSLRKRHELLVASPTEQWGQAYWMAGCVRKVIIGESGGRETPESLPLLCGTEASSLLGHTITPFGNETFMIGAPFMRKSKMVIVKTLLFHVDYGAVFVIRGSFSRWRCYYDDSIDQGAPPAMFGSTILQVEAPNQGSIIISSPGSKKVTIFKQ